MADLAANSAGEEIALPLPARVRVMLPLPLPEPLDYAAPSGIPPPRPGNFVRVDLGSRRVIGVVWEEADGAERLPVEKLKPILDVLPAPPLRPDLRRFVERVAAYTLAPPGMVLKMAMSVEEALLPRAPHRVCAITPSGAGLLESAELGQKLTPARRRVLQALEDGGACSAAELARRAGCGAGVVRGLIAAGHIGEEFVSGEPPSEPVPDWQSEGPPLSRDQEQAARRLVERVHDSGFSVTVLDGVTGSGKTETYFAAIAAALETGRQVLVLLPEIALGAQWLDRFKRRFGTLPAEWHSDVSQSARRDTWRAVATGRARIVV
ncbi:MAG: DEAD/DEAH box helicase family protein, partial [Alphaproteobacteria bacterium]|nr:DEAD/DEAH box helicase family protein [Alphaproteobacteria bacterium]